MCWFLCANPIVNQWLHPAADDACRKAQALKPLLAADLLEADNVLQSEDDFNCMRVAAPAGLGLRTDLRADLFTVPRIGAGSWRVSSQLRNKPFEFLAHAWCRFLLWLGGR
jgi:hypothetical protein